MERILCFYCGANFYLSNIVYGIFKFKIIGKCENLNNSDDDDNNKNNNANK